MLFSAATLMLVAGVSAADSPPGIIFPPDDSGATCDFSKCAFNKAFIAAETAGKDECVAACGKMTNIKGNDPCLSGCKIQMQIDTLVDLGKANVSSCADGLISILQMTVEEDDDYGSVDAGPDFGCLVGCKGRVKGKTNQLVKDDTLGSLKCNDWAPLLKSVQKNKCISQCTQETKWVIGNSTGNDKKGCAEEAKEEEEEAKEEKAAAALVPDFSCLIGCKGPGGKKMTDKTMSNLNCTQFDNMILNVRTKQKKCINKCTKATKNTISKLMVGDSCNMGGNYGDGYDYGDAGDYYGDYEDSGFHLNNSCLHTCPMGKQGKGTATGDKLEALSCKDFISWGKSVAKSKCTKECDDLTKASLADLSGRNAKDCDDGGHKSEIKSNLVAESESSQFVGKNVLSLTLLVGAAVGIVGTVAVGAVMTYRKRAAEHDSNSEVMATSLPEGFSHL